MVYKSLLLGSFCLLPSKATFEASSLMLEVGIFAFAYHNNFKTDFSNYALIAVSLFNLSNNFLENLSFSSDFKDPNEMFFQGL